MRKRLFYSLFLGAVLCMTTACSDDDNGGPGDGGGGNGNVPVTTVEQAQEEIDRVGKALAAKIDVERLKPTISLLEYCENTFFNEDDEVILPDYPNHPDYGWRSLMRTMRLSAQGDIAALASKRAIGDVYEISQLHGKWQWNETTEEWDQISDASMNNSAIYMFKYEGKDCVAELKGSGQEFEFARKDSTGYVYSETIKIPATITGTIKLNGELMIQLTVNTEACDYAGKQYSANATFEATNAGYKVTHSLLDNNSEAAVKSKLYSGNERLITMSCSVNGRNLADIDLIESGYFDGNANLKNGILGCNIMDDISLNITADNNNGLVDAFDYDGYYYYYQGDTVGSLESLKEAARVKAQRAVDAANQYVQAAMFFKNSTYSVPLTWQTVHYDYSYPGGYYYSGEWAAEPVLNFENGTTYTFGEYFTVARFQSLIAVYEELFGRFENL